MTEPEWLACEEPGALRAAVAGSASTRKLRWLACACCRRIWHDLEDERSRAAVEATEQYADSLIEKNALPAGQPGASRAVDHLRALSWEPGNASKWVRVVAATAAKCVARPTDYAE